ncbi:MAG: WG repeat-containing protein [Ruminococcaceae bacterium]|nr:WG repeat-containing protein [Oscillospiraceae bacterium]
MKRILAFLLILAMLFGSVCTLASCGDGNVNDKTNVEGNDKETSKDKNKGNNKKENKYANIKIIVGAYDDVYVYQNYNGKYGLLSPDGEIIYDGFYLYQTFSENSNYISCHNGSSTMNVKVSSILDKNGKTVLEVGEDNIEFISEITQGRILAYKMTDERPSGKTYDLICYSAKDMSEVFRIKGRTSIGYYDDFDGYGYLCVDDYYDIESVSYSKDDMYIDINGNKYRHYRYQNGIYVAEKFGKQFSELPAVPGIEETIDSYAWLKLAESYSEYKNSPYNTREYAVGATKNTLGQIATLYMKNTAEWCATMDKNGKILMEPTKDIMLKYEYNNWGTVTKCFTFSNDLCCAYQPSSGLWGYVDPYGTWKIKPQYNKVTTFSYDGLAVVDDLIVINTKGKVVLDISDTGDIYPLEGKYKRSGAYSSLYLTFSKDGTVVSTESGYGYTSNKTGSYELHGDSLIIDDFGYTAVLSEGTHTFEKSGDNIYIDGNLWVRVED